MIASMTGFGKASVATVHKTITVEIKAVNSKQLDLNLRVPNAFRNIETLIRNKVSPLLERGKVDFNINIVNSSGETDLVINEGVVKAYKDKISQLSLKLDVAPPSDWMSILIRLPEVLTISNTDADEEETEAVFKASEEAIMEFRNFRLSEGAKLYEFFFQKTQRIRFLLKELDNFECHRIAKVREKLESQLQKLNGVEYDKGRLEQELIYYIEKLDVTEEKVRLLSHLDYFDETLGEPDSTDIEGKGKKLGFIAQEMGREINTLGSKSNDANMQKIVVMMKDELEQIKEQVLNVL